MKFLKRSCSNFIFFLIQLILVVPVSAANVTNYVPILSHATDQRAHHFVAIRRFTIEHIPHLLLVDPATLQTRIVKESSVILSVDLPKELASSPYLTAVERHTSAPWPLQNDGAVRSDRQAEGVFLTVDMCPSKRPFERKMYESLPTFSRTGRPVPVAISMTGTWLKNHPVEFAWLKTEIAGGNLDVTWVNHSLTHPYDPAAPLAGNFLLTPGVDFEHEVLETERLLIQNGVVPSPFFRFPGLVSSKELMARLAKLSLIPLGSNAWLAKGEVPRDGSFILVHGNGNEPAGITRLLALFRERKGMRFLPIQKAFHP